MMSFDLKMLLWQKRSKAQLLGAAVGTFLGIFLLISALQLYFDLQQLLYGKENGAEQYVLLNKKVSLMNTLGASNTFSQTEIQNIEKQPFAQKVGALSQNQFKVSASSPMVGFYTDLFFEAVPDEFIDVPLRQWNWVQGDNEVPIVLSRDYLALYNFGFAPSQGLPQFTPSTIQKVTVVLTVKGKGQSANFNGRIIGFSDRINSILVPQTFLNFANRTYGDTPDEGASRLVLKTDNPNAPAFRSFLSSNGYEISSGRLIGAQTTILLNLLFVLIGVIGVIILLLSSMVFILNYQLLIAQSSEDIRLLGQLGYKDGQISGVLRARLLRVFLIVLLLALVTVFVGHYFITQSFVNQGFSIGSGLHILVYVATLILGTALIGVNFGVVTRAVKRLFV